MNCKEFYTATEVEVLRSTGQFDILTDPKYCASSDYLMRGDILCTKVKGHTVVVLTNGAKVTSSQAADENGVMYAESKDKSLAGTYEVTTGLNLRRGAGTQYGIITVLPEGARVKNYGYFTQVGETRWLYVAYKGKVGFCSEAYLVRV